MKNIILIIAFILSNLSYAHSDKIYSDIFGNVKVYGVTGFTEYSTFYKLKIIGILAQKLSEKLNYSDTILVQCYQDYTHSFSKDLYILESGNSQIFLPKDLLNTGEIKTNGSGISLRMNVDNLNIENSIRLIAYLIENNEETLELIKSKMLYFEEEVEYLEISTDKISEIINQKSTLCNELLNERIDLETCKNVGLNLYWEQNEFIFEYQEHDKKYKYGSFEDYFYFVLAGKEIFIFEDAKNFYYLTIENRKKKNIYIEDGSYWIFTVKKFKNAIVLFNRYNHLNVFVPERLEVISTFKN